MKNKQRHIFSFDKFQGLDKENKELTVAPFRASDGFNFYIDSGTLKTRPAIALKKNPTFILDADDYLIDWYDLRGVTVYVTKKHIYIEDIENDVLFNDESVDGTFIRNNFDPFDFQGKEPLFREEKGSLFIFCLGKIFVVGILKTALSETNEIYCLYDLQNKPNVGVSFDEELQELYIDLPKTYEPTLFIGNNRFDDVNNLSRVNKYKLFAQDQNVTRKNENMIYKLPTHYREEKHGSFDYIKDNLEVKLFNNMFENFKVIPIFMGVADENFVYSEVAGYGDFVTGLGEEGDPIIIEDKFLPKTPFEYLYDGETLSSVVSEQFGLSISDFFHLRIQGLEKTTFEYVLDYLQSKYEEVETWIDNKIIVFEMPYQVEEIRRDTTTNHITKRIQQIGTTKVYVQLRRFLYIPFDVDIIQNTYSSNSLYLPFPVDTDQNPWPNDPSFSETPDEVIDFGTPTTHTEVGLPYNATNTEKNNWRNNYQAGLLNEYKMYVYENQTDFDNDDIIAFRKRVHTGNMHLAGGTWYWYDWKLSFLIMIKVIKNHETIDIDLFDISYNEPDGSFDFTIKDFFFDYKKQPSIEVITKFEYNTDYDLIADSTFGVTFGSENRLFLAGNPNFPNIDRYNISNDLLGDNVKNQSFELSYFPSRHFRVVGGSGAINGYVVAMDTQLYVTKEKFENDEAFYIRERRLSEQGLVSYFEHKTNINRTPINNKCIVNFYNDILMLTKDGLFAIEISSNILTNQRLQKLRSGFINSDLVESLKGVDKKDIFMIEDNSYLYMFIDKKVYVADVRYIHPNPDSMVENVSYEIVDWRVLKGFRKAKFEGSDLILLSKDSKFYTLKENQTYDQTTERANSELFYQEDITNIGDVFQISESFKNDIESQYETYSDEQKPPMIEFDKVVANYGYRFGKQEHLEFNNAERKITFLPPLLSFVDFEVGQEITLLDTGSNPTTTIVESISEEKDYIIIEADLGGGYNLKELYLPLFGRKYYMNMVEWSSYYGFTISPVIMEDNGEAEEAFYPTKLYIPDSPDPFSGTIFYKKPIEMRWFSKITDFNNRIMEKTMFKLNLYVTRQEKENQLFFGYKTTKVIRDDTHGDKSFLKGSLSNPFNFDTFNFNIFGIQSFSEMGSSFPIKENNFLYIQFMFLGYGQVELNSFDILYKNNRMLKSIG